MSNGVIATRAYLKFRLSRRSANLEPNQTLQQTAAAILVSRSSQFLSAAVAAERGSSAKEVQGAMA